MSARRAAFVTASRARNRVELVFPFDRCVVDALKLGAGAAWDPVDRVWWCPMGALVAAARVLEQLGHVVEVTDQASGLEAAVCQLLAAVSPCRRARLVRALAAAAHPDGDGPDRPVAADTLVRLATKALDR